MRKASLVSFTFAIVALVAFGVVALAPGGTRRSAAATQVSYEPFCYTHGGAPGSLGAGWAGGWSPNGTLVNSQGLENSPAGFAFQSTACVPSSPNNSLGPTPGSAATRPLAAPVGPSTGATGGDLTGTDSIEGARYSRDAGDARKFGRRDADHR